jgi:hypothetical protein
LGTFLWCFSVKEQGENNSFFPFVSCVCSFAPLMEKVGRISSSFKDAVEVQMKSTSSKEARAYSVQDSCT